MRLVVLTLYFFVSLCTMAQNFDIQGHRGARGIKPENTIPGFIYALDTGVTTIELDVIISKDGKIVVSHEPFLNSAICLDPKGNPIEKSKEKEFNLYKMDYAEIKKCDCGSLGNPDFSSQEKAVSHKPLLSDVIKAVEWHIKSYTQYEVDYNIELKSSKKGDGVFNPSPAVFSKMVFELVDSYIPMHRVIIQSFDFRILNFWKKNYPHVRLATLVENTKSLDVNLANLGFKPDIYSPDYLLLDSLKIESLHKSGMKVIPWTVNETEQMKQLIDWGVDGIITDYPNKLVVLIKSDTTQVD